MLNKYALIFLKIVFDLRCAYLSNIRTTGTQSAPVSPSWWQPGKRSPPVDSQANEKC